MSGYWIEVPGVPNVNGIANWVTATWERRYGGAKHALVLLSKRHGMARLVDDADNQIRDEAENGETWKPAEQPTYASVTDKIVL